VRCFENYAQRLLLDKLDAQATTTLAQLGFTQYQAAVWLAMTQGFPVTAYELARRCRLPRPNVYAAVRKLVEMGAADLVGSHPDTFAPTQPQLFLERQANDLRERCQALSQRLTLRMQRAARGAIRTRTGLAECETALRQEIGLARQYLWLKGGAALLRRLLPDLRAALMRGVALKLIVFGPTRALLRQLRGAEVWPHEGSGQRITAATDALLTLARDGEVVVAAAFNDEPQLTHARDHLMVYLIHSYLLHEVFLAEMASGKAGEPVRRRLLELRQQHRPALMEKTVVRAG
jgi:HTH-type transcriptional regulator, sugar sensing transcriptional regulator